ncbi:MAG: hypothetical protein NZ455_04035 [Bacteroidia bacterium]|nr:hypothetical protein [Bacteroidia bacterium]
MRHAEGKPSGLVRSPRPLFYSCPGGGAQHRQPVARRPCGHMRSVTPTRTRPKKQSKTINLNIAI